MDGKLMELIILSKHSSQKREGERERERERERETLTFKLHLLHILS